MRPTLVKTTEYHPKREIAAMSLIKISVADPTNARHDAEDDDGGERSTGHRDSDGMPSLSRATSLIENAGEATVVFGNIEGF